MLWAPYLSVRGISCKRKLFSQSGHFKNKLLSHKQNCYFKGTLISLWGSAIKQHVILLLVIHFPPLRYGRNRCDGQCHWIKFDRNQRKDFGETFAPQITEISHTLLVRNPSFQLLCQWFWFTVNAMKYDMQYVKHLND